MTDRELMLVVRKAIDEGGPFLMVAAVVLDERLKQPDWSEPYEPHYWPETELEQMAA